MKLIKSLNEIKERIEAHIEDRRESLMIAMCNHQHPLQAYHPEYIKEGFEPNPLTEEAVIEEMRGYMNFAFGKAHGQRGISASRSVWKYVQWLWLIEDEDLLAFAENESNYAMYGLPVLRKISDKYGFEEVME